MDGLHRLEYRGYDSAGVAVLNNEHNMQIVRRVGKVKELDDALAVKPLLGGTGIAHTRWATTASLPRLMLTRIAAVKSQWYITVSLRTTKN